MLHSVPSLIVPTGPLPHHIDAVSLDTVTQRLRIDTREAPKTFLGKHEHRVFASGCHLVDLERGVCRGNRLLERAEQIVLHRTDHQQVHVLALEEVHDTLLATEGRKLIGGIETHRVEIDVERNIDRGDHLSVLIAVGARTLHQGREARHTAAGTRLHRAHQTGRLVEEERAALEDRLSSQLVEGGCGPAIGIDRELHHVRKTRVVGPVENRQPGFLALVQRIDHVSLQGLVIRVTRNQRRIGQAAHELDLGIELVGRLGAHRFQRVLVVIGAADNPRGNYSQREECHHVFLYLFHLFVRFFDSLLQGNGSHDGIVVREVAAILRLERLASGPCTLRECPDVIDPAITDVVAYIAQRIQNGARTDIEVAHHDGRILRIVQTEEFDRLAGLTGADLRIAHVVEMRTGNADNLAGRLGGRNQHVGITDAALVRSVLIQLPSVVPLVVAVTLVVLVGKELRSGGYDRVFRQDHVAVIALVLRVGHDVERIHLQQGSDLGHLLLAHAARAGLELVEADDIGILGLDQIDILLDGESRLGSGLVRLFERKDVPYQYFQLHALCARHGRREQRGTQGACANGIFQDFHIRMTASD
uniref:Uncharacterized protein n=1 Tax=Siphoviridae sp. ctBLh2 TaxID=2827803 RepID=A0A8S5S359_9CAUD|nr:MAG TPA: hypothetical protein [Siphoviridae sp. ctBLh2]